MEDIFNNELEDSNRHFYINSQAMDYLKTRFPAMKIHGNLGTENMWADGVKYGFRKNYTHSVRVFAITN